MVVATIGVSNQASEPPRSASAAKLQHNLGWSLEELLIFVRVAQ